MKGEVAAVDILIVILAGLIPITAASLYSLIDRVTRTADAGAGEPTEIGEEAMSATGVATDSASAAEPAEAESPGRSQYPPEPVPPAESDFPAQPQSLTLPEAPAAPQPPAEDPAGEHEREADSGHRLSAFTVHHGPVSTVQPEPEIAR